MLWRSGQDNLTIVDVQTGLQREVIKQFWTFQNRSSQPKAACANRTAEKILAASQAGPDDFIVHYYEDSKVANVAYARYTQEAFPTSKNLFFFIFCVKF